MGQKGTLGAPFTSRVSMFKLMVLMVSFVYELSLDYGQLHEMEMKPVWELVWQLLVLRIYGLVLDQLQLC